MNDILANVVGTLAMPVAVAGTALLYRGFQHVGILLTAQDKANLDHEAETALKLGIGKVIGGASGSTLAAALLDGTTMANVLDTATGYFKQRFPDRVKAIAGAVGTELDANHSVNQAVRDTLTARLTNIIPATTPTPGPGGTANGAQQRGL